ncbi:ATP-binding domain-containing protein [Paenibacillus aurantius]|uniref:ATP-binding domain-containing protein n=1 Tax=Paenibacillus aurantius TaxID=2918900 RepID=A0AA96LBC6_9BACL|nr:ATP-binding domain-containing protein [Paenibacillus aurantius]WNQ10095.1 ATP-binding domain-containing protein [Paenibacillus aurantius]
MDEKTQSAYQEEQQRLEAAKKEIDRQLERLRKVPVYHGTDLTEQALESVRESSRRSLGRAQAEPYFGRLDFHETGQGEPAALYIGKVGVEEEKTGKLMVIDWRAPVASLFYSFSGGRDAAAYESPEGLIEGLVYLKRNLVIRERILQRVVDTYDRETDTASAGDEFLVYRLGENKDNKLRDIVSTIQAEQDRIIRSARNTALIIQGVAGSGKTTVALHRLAYLLYQYRENVRAERMIIFAPNAMFLDYISQVLPELGVGNIQQSTFGEWALDLLGHEVQLEEPAGRLEQWFGLGPDRPAMDDRAPGRIKGSDAFRLWLDRCLAVYEQGCVPEAGFAPWEGLVLPARKVHEWYHVENKHYPLLKRRERVVARIKRWLEMEVDKRLPHERKELKKKASQKLRTYLAGWPEYTPFTFYKELFQQESPFFLAGVPQDLSAGGWPGIAGLAEESRKLFRRKKVQPEDLAPLVHLHAAFYGITGDRLFDHTVLDEAQDFSPFQVALLDRFTKNHSFTILGDLSQGIHAYQGISAWEEFSRLFGEGHAAYFQLERSYRSTMEIIHFANVVLSRGVAGSLLAVPVFRSGSPVRVIGTPKGDREETILGAVRRLTGSGYQTVALIGRTEKECAGLEKLLDREGIAANRIVAGQSRYGGGMSIVPAYLAKGLEFDAVLVLDADETHYSATAPDAKLLYVACTRALHELWVLYTGNPSPLLETEDPEFVSTEQPG